MGGGGDEVIKYELIHSRYSPWACESCSLSICNYIL